MVRKLGGILLLLLACVLLFAGRCGGAESD